MKSIITELEAVRRLMKAPRQTPEMFNRLRIVRALRIRIVYRNIHGRPCPY